MVVLENLVKNNNIVEYDYHGGNEDVPGHVSFDVEKDMVISFSYSKVDAESNFQTLYKKSIQALHRLIESDNYLPRYEYIWY